MSKEQMIEAAKICENLTFSDVDLKLAIKALELVTTFLKARGPRWYLAYSLLCRELLNFQDLIERRKQE